MYLTTEEELKTITDKKIISTIVNKGGIGYDKEEFINMATFEVKKSLVKRYNAKRYFESQAHCFNYVQMIVYKSCYQRYYRSKDRVTYPECEEYFTGESEHSLRGSSIPVYDEGFVDEGVKYVVDALRSLKGGDYTEKYISYRFGDGERPKFSKDYLKLNFLTKYKIKEFAKLL